VSTTVAVNRKLRQERGQVAARLLAVVPAEGTELRLARSDSPAATVYQEALFQQGQPAAMFVTDHVQRDYEWMKAADAEFKMPPTKVTGSTIAQANDNCGSLIQITQLNR
jgi:hypothetical protein